MLIVTILSMRETQLLGFRLHLLMWHRSNCGLVLFLTYDTSNIILLLRFVVLYNLFFFADCGLSERYCGLIFLFGVGGRSEIPKQWAVHRLIGVFIYCCLCHIIHQSQQNVSTNTSFFEKVTFSRMKTFLVG